MTAPEQVLLGTILFAGAGSAFLFVWALDRFRAEITDAAQLGDLRREKIRSVGFRVLIALARPLGVFLRYYTLRSRQKFQNTGHRSMLLSLHDKAQRSLTAAGNPHGINADEYLGLLLLCGLIGLGIGGMGTATTGWTLLLAIGILCGSLWPMAWLHAQVARRKTRVFRALPFALDLLTLSVEAGLDFTSALGRIVTKVGETPLGQEFGELLRQIQMGQPRADALRQLSRRVDLEEMSNVTGALIQADELGASIGPILRIQAEQMRVRREQIAEKRAMEAPVKILLPLILFIFPTVFLIILGPVALKLLSEHGMLP